jgi:phage tail-like protein
MAVFIKKIFIFFKKLIQCMMDKYPLSASHFKVEWGGTRIDFTEVSGLNIEYDIIQHRSGNIPDPSIMMIPGLKHPTNIILKRGIVKGDVDFYNWINTIKLNQVERRDIVISLLDEKHEPVMIWKAKNAWPVKLSGPELKANGNEVAIESIELAHEGLELES